MVTAVSSFDPLAYLNQIKGISTPSADSSTTGSTPDISGSASTDDSSAPSTSSTDTSSPAISSSNILGLSPTVLSLLQDTSSGTSQAGLLSGLLGGSSASSSDPLSGIYATLLYQDTQALPLQEAIDTSAQTQATPSTASSVQSVIDSYNNTLNTNNQALLQNAQSVLAANNGTLPITA